MGAQRVDSLRTTWLFKSIPYCLFSNFILSFCSRGVGVSVGEEEGWCSVGRVSDEPTGRTGVY